MKISGLTNMDNIFLYNKTIESFKVILTKQEFFILMNY